MIKTKKNLIIFMPYIGVGGVEKNLFMLKPRLPLLDMGEYISRKESDSVSLTPLIHLLKDL